MFVAEKLRQENIAEYLLFIWQTEDLLRAVQFNTDIIEQQFNVSPESIANQKAAIQWYTDLAEMMRSEHITEKGHLQIAKNILRNLKELHEQLVHSEKFDFYRAVYYKALPIIIEIRKKSGNEQIDELEACFNLLYGIMILRLEKKEVSAQTIEGQRTISEYLRLLVSYYHQNKKAPLVFE